MHYFCVRISKKMISFTGCRVYAVIIDSSDDVSDIGIDTHEQVSL